MSNNRFSKIVNSFKIEDDKPLDNTPTESLVTLNISVSEDYKTKVKTAALASRQTLKEFVVAALDEYMEHH